MQRYFRGGLCVFMILGLLSSACTRIDRVKVLESDLETPYDSLGTLEVKMRVSFTSASGLLASAAEVLTFGAANTLSRSERYKQALRAKLSREAHGRYSADAIIHVEYWPDPTSKNFPDGYLYARGEMVKFRRFPAPVAT